VIPGGNAYIQHTWFLRPCPPKRFEVFLTRSLSAPDEPKTLPLTVMFLLPRPFSHFARAIL
jgi:hypothetical protein